MGGAATVLLAQSFLDRLGASPSAIAKRTANPIQKALMSLSHMRMKMTDKAG